VTKKEMITNKIVGGKNNLQIKKGGHSTKYIKNNERKCSMMMIERRTKGLMKLHP